MNILLLALKQDILHSNILIKWFFFALSHYINTIHLFYSHMCNNNNNIINTNIQNYYSTMCVIY